MGLRHILAVCVVSACERTGRHCNLSDSLRVYDPMKLRKAVGVPVDSHPPTIDGS